MLYNQLRKDVNILEIDMLTLAIELAMTIGWSWVEGEQVFHSDNRSPEVHRVPDGSVDEFYSIYLTLIGHLFQVGLIVRE